MSDPTAGFRRSPFTAPLIGGAVAALLYLSVALSFTFLLPLQIVFGRRGRKTGMAASALCALIIGVVQVARLGFSRALGLADAAIVLLPPFVFIAALALLNAAFWDGRLSAYRAFIVAAVVAALAAPALVAIGGNQDILGYFEERIGAVVGSFQSQVTGSGYDVSALAASLDPKALTQASLRILASCYALLILGMLGLSRWLGNRLSGAGSPGRLASPAMADYRLPYAFLWPFLAAWTYVAAAILMKASPLVQAIAWNLALVLSAGYAAQGLGIASYMVTRWKMPRTLRFAIAATAILAIVTPTVGMVVAALIPILGVTEVWIPYRNPKGVGA